ncbi:hypothetical protein A9O63_12925 [Cereibacter johrii]|uniref:Uncharacterized protein n=1 Tax=Cereibacter johrii TaxID=445629 RepID=A0ABX5JDU6_9RHOB|nr:hypothetical protein A9O63_12925 [Cereibacter johrii]PTM80484.1 hypothetical protein C8J29_102566 [Cereibacter johrii]
MSGFGLPLVQASRAAPMTAGQDLRLPEDCGGRRPQGAPGRPSCLTAMIGSLRSDVMAAARPGGGRGPVVSPT